MIKIISVVGARPNFIKIAPIIKQIERHNNIANLLVHTGQHYDVSMSDVFFQNVDIPLPKVNLGVRKLSNLKQIARIIKRFEPLCLLRKPDYVLVVGDANPTIACSLVAANLKIPVIHVEAGLRSYDRTMPEEINRITTDHLSDLLFITEEDARNNLLREGIDKKRIHFVGNVMIDTLIENLSKIKKSLILERLRLQKHRYCVLTLHRPSNVDCRETLEPIFETFHKLSLKCPIVFPVHPRTLEKIRKFRLSNLLNNIQVIRPLGYLDFLNLMQNAKFVLTDSGGIQEETTYLRVPCLTIRENTERPVTVNLGTNEIVGTKPSSISRAFAAVLRGKVKRGKVPPLWDGKAATRIVKILLGHYKRANYS